ncbi:MAG: bacillithiol biosynthesis cysteine-adding enzyme BshC [Chitinophagales bacterium]
MNCNATRLPYQRTGFFSGIIEDYLNGSEKLADFRGPAPDLVGIKEAIFQRRKFNTKRNILVEELKKQYSGIRMAAEVRQNIDRLMEPNCFTITTAHQPALFTGSLYFIYKIIHTIKLARQLSESMTDCNFVPIFYMGSEDADLEELSKIYFDQQEVIWETNQTGAVGRMKTKGLEKIIERIEGEFSVDPFGPELVRLLKESYLESENVQTACFKLIDALFSKWGVVVLIPDNENLKRLMLPIFEEDLFSQTPFKVLEKPLDQLSQHYKIQAQPREINLFYLKDGLRGRIEKIAERFIVHDSKLSFSESELRSELQNHPERFSPNVILRGIYQETVLPNILFLGGGGELAYWLEFKPMFKHYGVPYPILVLRNSFLIVEKKWKEKMDRSGIPIAEIFKPEEELVNDLVRRESRNQLGLEKEIVEANSYYEHLKTLSGSIDPSLSQHVESLHSKAIRPIMELEKKLLKAEKRKFEEQHKQIAQIKSGLFPLENLQERIENFIPYYARWGRTFLQMIYDHSPGLEQEFTLLEER